MNIKKTKQIVLIIICIVLVGILIAFIAKKADKKDPSDSTKTKRFQYQIETNEICKNLTENQDQGQSYFESKMVINSKKINDSINPNNIEFFDLPDVICEVETAIKSENEESVYSMKVLPYKRLSNYIFFDKSCLFYGIVASAFLVSYCYLFL